MKSSRPSLLVAVCLAASAAWAQLPTIIASSQPYVPLSAGTVVATLNGDDMGVLVPLGFTFPWFGQNYTHVMLNSNGVIVPGNAGTTTCATGCLGNASFPTVGIPDPAIAGFWDDLDLRTAGSVRTLQSAGEFTVEYAAVPRYAATGATVTFQIKLTAAGALAFHYGSITGSGTTWNASAGFEDNAGTLGANLFSGCTSSCTETNFIPNALFTIGEPQDPDLGVPSVTIADFVTATDGNLSFTVNATLRNFGRTDANNFSWRAYLSVDRLLDTATDVQVAQGGPLSLLGADGGVSTVDVTGAAATVTAPATGEYYVLVMADATNTVVEASETNNVGSTVLPFVQGLDLLATSISGPALTGGGNLESVTISFVNRGTQPAGSVRFRILMSLDRVVSADDLVAYDGSRTVSGGQTINEVVAVTVPSNAPNAALYWLLDIDPLNATAEANELNNAVSSAALTDVRRADLVLQSVSLLDPVTGQATTRARFGQTARLRLRFLNAGGANANNFRAAMVLSADPSMSFLSDSYVCDQLVAQTVPGTVAIEVTLDCALPLANLASVPFVTGDYYFFGVLDSTSAVFETSKANNTGMSGPIQVTAPGPDLVVSYLEAPLTAGAGEVVPLARTIGNPGSASASAATYRYFASTDAIITSSDVPLPILTGAVSALEGTVALAAGTMDSSTDLVQLPATLLPGAWYLGCIVDFGGAVSEADERNNTRAFGPVSVVGSGLVISTSQLPEGITGRPYGFQLLAQSPQGAVSWSLVAGEGTLAAGLTLSASGLISGTPVAPGVASFTVRVTDAGRQATARLALRVRAEPLPLEITTTSAPAILTDPSVQYSLTLAAAGGTPPYQWSVLSGTLPANLVLSSDGVLGGYPSATLSEGVLSVTFQVRDFAGATAQRALVLRLVSPAALAVQTHWLPHALVGQRYDQALTAANNDGSPLAEPLVWTAGSALPDGLVLAAVGSVARLTGTPTRGGAFEFDVTVQDASGRRDTARLALVVSAQRLALTAPGLPAIVHRSESVSFAITAGAASSPQFALVSGQLPPGVALGTDGTVSGVIASDQPEGSFDFVVEATDATGARGLGVFTLRVSLAATGCSSAGSLAPWWLLALATLLLRRRSAPVAALGAVLAFVPLTAQAQYQVVGPSPLAYPSLTGGTLTTAGATITLPFVMPFFDTQITSVAMSQYGYLALGGGATMSGNQAVPHSNPSPLIPRAYIAPWWDMPSASSSLPECRFEVTGSAPRRVMAFEWHVARGPPPAMHLYFQVRLYEGTGQIRFLYGPTPPPPGSASVGLQKDLSIGVPGLTCASTASCTTGSFPSGMFLDFFPPPDLVVPALTAPPTGYAGTPLSLRATLENRGGRPVSGAQVRFFLSTDASLDVFNDTVLGTSTVANVDAQERVQVAFTAPLPAVLTQSSYFLFAVADPGALIAESLENNNVGGPVALSIGAPIADLVPTLVTAPATAQAGSPMQVSRTIQNMGALGAGASRYTWVLSENAAVSVSDRALNVGSLVALAPQASDSATEQLTLPADVLAGNYWLGLCANFDANANPQFGFAEASLLNNCLSAASPLRVTSGALTIATTQLLQATVGVPYGAQLGATGGDGLYAWSVVSGALPTGLVLSATGAVQGTPAAVGSSSFDVQVSSGGATRTATLQLEVANPGALAIPAQPLPQAIAGRDYVVDLFASGGQPPYQYAVAQGAVLPQGLTLSAAGALAGRPAMSGDYVFRVSVTDATGSSAEGELALTVLSSPVSLRFSTPTLANGVLGEGYLQPLEVQGGRPPYVLELVRFQQLPGAVTDEAGALLGDGNTSMVVPSFLGLALEGASLQGTPAHVGRFMLGFKARDAAGAEATSSLQLEVTSSLRLVISTTALPDAEAGAPYSAILESGGAAAQYALACVGCAEAGRLPPGLGLTPDGRIAGTPILDAALGESTFTFLVKASDGQGRQDLRGLSITVRPAARSGCTTVSLVPLGWLLLPLWWRRRAHRPR